MDQVGVPIVIGKCTALTTQGCLSTWCAHAQTYLFSGPTFESQLFHHVHVTGIPYGKKCAPCPRALHFALTICY